MDERVGAIVLAVTVVFVAWSTYFVDDAIRRGSFCALLNIPIPLFIPLLYALGFLSGILFPRRRRRPKVVLDREEERFVVEQVLKKGSLLQSEVSRAFGKVKASRVVTALERKGLVKRQRVGRTYLILPGPALVSESETKG